MQHSFLVYHAQSSCHRQYSNQFIEWLFTGFLLAMISTTFLNLIFCCGFDLKIEVEEKFGSNMAQTIAERNWKWRRFF